MDYIAIPAFNQDQGDVGRQYGMEDGSSQQSKGSTDVGGGCGCKRAVDVCTC